jgi:hypothetical protein
MQLANLDTMVADANRHSGGATFLAVEHFCRSDSSVRIFTAARPNELLPSNFLYSGTTGEPKGEQAALGTAPSVGASLFSLMGPLHFGNFAGAASKAVWVGLGSAGAYVTFTGMLLWTRRRADQPAWQRIERFVNYVGYGLPFALAVAPYAFFLLRGRVEHLVIVQTQLFLVAALVIGIAAYAIKDQQRLRRGLLAGTGIALLGLPVLRLATGGMGWGDSVAAGIGAVVAVDCALVVLGAACLWAIRPAGSRVPQGAAMSARGRTEGGAEEAATGA